MKTLFAVGLTVCAVSLTGCSSNSDTNTENNQANESVETTELTEEEATNEVEEAPTQEAEEVEEVQEPCPVEITEIFDKADMIGNETLNIVVKNNGTEAVKYFEAYAVFWDNNGYPIKANFGYDEIIKINSDNPNLPVGETDTWSWQPYVDGDDFGKAEVFISKVELYDGTIWENTSAQETATKRFEQLNKEDNSSSDETSSTVITDTKLEVSPIEITSIFDEKDSIGNDTLNIVVKNNGTEAVKNFEAYAVFWDNNGYPLKANFGYDEILKISSENPNLQPGETATWSWQPYVDGDDFGKAEVFISKVELYDGTIFENSSAQSEATKCFDELNK